MVILVFGGARSGKSKCAEQLAIEMCPDPSKRYYLATGQAIDSEMRARIYKHRQDRVDKFVTVEEPINIAEAILEASKNAEVVLIDCMTTWLGNLSYQNLDNLDNKTEDTRQDPDAIAEKRVLERVKLEDCEGCFPPVSRFKEVLKKSPCHIIIVSNELGMGLVPADSESRLFRDRQGRLNQMIAEYADKVIFVAAGIPLILKGDK